MKRISILALSFLIFSGVAYAETENQTSTSSASTTPVLEAATTSAEQIVPLATSSIDIAEVSVSLSEKVLVIKKQFDAYVLRLDLLNEKIMSNATKLESSGFDVEKVANAVAESNSALENAKISMQNLSLASTLEGKSFEGILLAISETKKGLGSAINEIRKAQEKGKIAVSELKILVLE